MLIIGELINCTRKKVGESARARDAEFFRQLARKQVDAGAHVLDVNGGIPDQEVELVTWLVDLIQEATNVPLSLDSADPMALSRALPRCKERPIVNSISDEPARLALLPLLKEYKPRLIVLCMSEAGPPSGVEDRVATAGKLVDRLTAEGFALDDLYLDGCAMPAATSQDQGAKLMAAIHQIGERYPGIHFSAGVSNVSFGLPQRKLLNEAFILLLMAHGLDAAIVDPCDQQLMANVLAAEALLGRDEYSAEYLRAYRQGHLSPAVPVQV